MANELEQYVLRELHRANINHLEEINEWKLKAIAIVAALEVGNSKRAPANVSYGESGIVGVDGARRYRPQRQKCSQGP